MRRPLLATICMTLTACLVLAGLLLRPSARMRTQVIEVATAPAAPRAAADGSYTVLEPLSPFTLDPARMTWDHDLRLANALFDGLVRWDPQTFEIEPGVASKWEVSPDGLVYTFHLRDIARWSTGETITSADFAYSWQRLLMPDTAADYSQLLFALKGGREFFDWRNEQLKAYAARPEAQRTHEAALALRADADAKFRESVGVDASDPRAFRVTLARPLPFFLEVCAYVPTFAVHKASVEQFVAVNAATGRIEQQHGWTKPPRLVSSGAYTLARWRFKRDLLLEKNPNYWDADHVRAPRVTVRFIEDANTRGLAFRTGAGDWNTDVLVDYVGDMVRAAELQRNPTIHGYSRFGTYFWSFNCAPKLPSGRENPLRDPRVRRALAMSVDKGAIARRVRDAGEEVTGTLIPPGVIRGYDPERTIHGPEFNPEAARRLLAEAGWTVDPATHRLTDSSGAGRGEFATLDLLTPGGSYHEKVALALASGWEREIGVGARITIKDSRSIKENLRTGDYMVARGGWFGDFADPSSFLRIHRTGDGNNDRAYSSPAFDDLFDRAERERDPAERTRLFEQAERLVSETDVPLLPLWRFRHFYEFDATRLKGVSANPRMMQRFDRIWLEPAPAKDACAGAAP